MQRSSKVAPLIKSMEFTELDFLFNNLLNFNSKTFNIINYLVSNKIQINETTNFFIDNYIKASADLWVTTKDNCNNSNPVMNYSLNKNMLAHTLVNNHNSLISKMLYSQYTQNVLYCDKIQNVVSSPSFENEVKKNPEFVKFLNDLFVNNIKTPYMRAGNEIFHRHKGESYYVYNYINSILFT
jgi:hypothetical protein